MEKLIDDENWKTQTEDEDAVRARSTHLTRQWGPGGMVCGVGREYMERGSFLGS